MLLIALIKLKRDKKVLFRNHIAFMETAIVLFSSILYVIVIAKIAPYQTDRYVFAIFPLLVIGFIGIFYNLLLNLFNKNVSLISLCFVCMLINLFGLACQNVNYMFYGYSEVLETSKKYNANDCIYFSYSGRTATECFMDLKDYAKVYMHTDKLEDPISMDTDIFSNHSDLILYIDTRAADPKGILTHIFNNSSMTNYEKIYESSVFSCYHLYS